MSTSPIAGPDSARHALRTMWTTRRFEEAVDDLFARGLMHGTMHLSIGQEAVATGVCLALRDDDADHVHPPRARPLHRQGRRPEPHDGRAARQGDRLLPRPRRLHAHRRRRHRQPRRQRHRRRRHPDRRRRRAGLPAAAATDQVVACFFGDGAANEGAFHEGLNLAAIWDLPVVFICENNKYGMSMSTEMSVRDRPNHRRAGRRLRHRPA